MNTLKGENQMTENTNHKLQMEQLQMELNKANNRADEYAERLTKALEEYFKAVKE